MLLVLRMLTCFFNLSLFESPPSLFIFIYCLIFCIVFETRSHVAKDTISFLIPLAYMSQILINHGHDVTIPGDLTQSQVSVRQITSSTELHPQLSI